MKITISNNEGVVYGQYVVTTFIPDTMEDIDLLDEMKRASALVLEDRDSILDTLEHDIAIYMKQEDLAGAE
tara:strand:- start:84 stop:296 length:213 start_codon:yes stop_codon:yes gene_type:complete